jgi:NADPH:quinone reductase-like Zn-dependent oxidoreductase/SAM-dependent methyltransferase/NAD(P)-dependent dehydrogenase (short-subunit alcohol dehydrogenase family)/acyl carrier protein
VITFLPALKMQLTFVIHKVAVMPAAGLFNMALIAASQVYEDTPGHLQISGYMLRNTTIKTALKIPEDDFGVEVILSMELSNEATAQSPDWARFSISSVSRTNDTWDEHCSGLVKVDVAQPLDFPKLSAAMDARTTNAGTWYKHFAAIGLGYGKTFQALSEIRSDPVNSRAVAKVGLKTTAGTIKGGESSYPIHPASLDSIFQLGLISCYGGQTENAKNAFVPVHLSEMYLRCGNNAHDFGNAIAHGQVRGLRGAYAKLQLSDPAGDLVMNIDSLRCISYLDGKPSTDNESNQFSSPYARLVWRPDIRLMSGDQCDILHPPPQENVDNVHFFPLMNMFAAIILVEIYETLLRGSDRPKPTGIGGHFATWVCRRVEGNGSPEIVDARKLSSQERLVKLKGLYSQIDHIVEIQIVKRLHDNMEAILWEQKTAVELLLADGILTALYETGMLMTSAYPQLSRLFQLLGHADPNLRILELGAGTGGATRVAMKALSSANGIKRYKDYTFTDVSAGFLATARENMADHYDVDFSVLDIETDPLSQGYEASYDIVMASQTLHATMTIANTLDNCRRLLKPGGKLILLENTQNHDFVGIMLGTLTGYWHGIPDGRTEAPFLSLEAWDKALKNAGFSGTELLFKDYPDGQATTTVIMSTLPASDGSEHRTAKRKTAVSDVQLLHSSKQASSLVLRTAKELEGRGVRVDLMSIEDVEGSLPSNARVIADLDNSNLLVDANREQLERFKYIVSKSQSLFLLTSGGITKASNPDISFIPGLLRTLANENPSTRFMSLDVDTCPDNTKSDDKRLVESILDLEFGLQQRDDSGKSRDSEYVWQDGCMWVSRFIPDDGLAAYDNNLKAKVSLHSQLVPLDSQGPVRAAFETPGILSSLYFRPYTELQEPLPHDWIVVKVAAVGLNWKDLGLSSGRFDGNNLSSEYSGIVTEVGPSVGALRVGDKVYGMGKGHFGNYTRVPAAFAKRLQPQDNLVEVATMPLVYMTAVYAFEHITRLRKNQKVLIQSATGGLGLAAIQLAQSKGAEVYATVGTSDKVQFLVETMKLPASHIFMSRSISDLVTAAGSLPKGGFDSILSTSRGEMLYASLRALAPLGHLIDVGRTEVGDAKMIGLELFQKSANFSSFDLSLVLDEDAEVGGELIQAVDEHYRAGRIGPIRPFTTSCISKLDQTLLNFSKGTHIGKLVVTFQPDAQVRMVPTAPRASFDPAARYIVSGGLGGLGRSIVTWMCSHGARDLILLSRNGAATDEARMLVETLQARGVAVEAVKCDVSNLDDVLKVTRDASSSSRPIKGVLHAAVSYLDISFDKVSIERWQQSLAAKISGTRNLHEATQNLPLDFFVMTTSTESVYALATQSAYTAANVYQEAFARYRRQLGLVASTASFGLVTDVGSVGTDSATVELFKRNRTQTMTEREFLELLEPVFFKSGLEHTWCGMEQDPLSVANYYTGLDPAVLASIDAANPGSNTSLPQWYDDARVSQIMRAYQDAGRHGNSKGGAGKHDSEDSSPAAVMARLRKDFEDKIRASNADGDRKEVSAFAATAIAQTIAGMLYIDAEGMNTDKTVAEYGIDSLISAELRNWLRNAFNAEISTLVLLDSHTSIAQLAANIVDIGVERLSEEE